MKRYTKCSHSHNAKHFERKDGHQIYDEYIKWKYTVGYAGTAEICWDCYLKNKELGKDI